MNLSELKTGVAATSFEHRQHRLLDLKENPSKENAADFLVELAGEHPEWSDQMEAILRDLMDDRIDVPTSVKRATETMQKWRQIARKEAPKVAAKVEKAARQALSQLRVRDPYLASRTTEIARLMHTATIDMVEDLAESVWVYNNAFSPSGYLTAFGDVYAVIIRIMLARDRSRYRRWRYSVAADTESLAFYGDKNLNTARPHTLRINSPRPSNRKLVDID
jgi:hypothetical protein